MKKVTIITATYNLIENNRKEHFIQMFNSIQSQTYGNIEHLIKDGGSKDGTLDLIKECQDFATNKNINIRIISESDRGIYDAFNEGIKNSSGDYIIFMNSDDYYYTNDAIQKMVDAIEKKNADFTCAIAKVEESKDKHFYFKPDMKKYVLGMPFCHQTMLCKKELFNKYGYFNEEYKTAADYEFIVKILKSGVKGVKLNDVLVYFRYYGAGSDNTIVHSQIVDILKKNIYINDIISKEDIYKIILKNVTLQILRKMFIMTFLSRKDSVFKRDKGFYWSYFQRAHIRKIRRWLVRVRVNKNVTIIGMLGYYLNSKKIKNKIRKPHK